jgi:hypothetical protein
MKRPRPAVAWTVGLAVTAVAGVVVARAVDTAALSAAWAAVTDRPLKVTAVLTVYAAAFVLRGEAWRRVLPRLALGQSLAALHVALAGNHVLPFRLGEALRVTSVVRRVGIPVAPATASTVTLRAADVAGAGAIAVGVLAVAAVAVGLVWVKR